MRIRKLISLIVLFCLVFTAAGPGYVFARKNTVRQNYLRVPASKGNIDIPAPGVNEADEINKNVRTTIGDVVNHFAQGVLPKLNYEKFYELSQKVAEVKRNNKKIIVMGEGRSGEVIAAFQKYLEEQGVNVVRLKESKTVPEIEDGDMIILISGSGTTTSIMETAEIVRKIKSKKSKKNIVFIGITATPNAETWKGADIVLRIPGKTKLEGEGILTMGGEFEQAALWVLYRFSQIIFSEKNQQDFIAEFKKVLEIEIESLKGLPERLPEREITDFVNLLEKAVRQRQRRKIFIAGKTGIDNHLVEIFAMRMQNLHKIKENFRALVYNVYDVLKPECQEGDILIVLSNEGDIAKNKCIIKEVHKNDIVLITASGVNYGLSKQPTINIKLNSQPGNFSIEAAVLADSLFEALRSKGKLDIPKSALRLGHIQDTDQLTKEATAEVKKVEKPEITYTPKIENVEKIFSGFTNDINNLLKSLEKDKSLKVAIYGIYQKLKKFDKTSGKVFLFGEEKERLILDDFGKQLYAPPLGYLFAVPNEKSEYDELLKNRAAEGKKDLKIFISKLGIKETEEEDKTIIKMLILEGIIEALLSSKGALTEKEFFSRLKSYIGKINQESNKLKINREKFQTTVKRIIEAKLNDREVFIFGTGRSSDIIKLLGYDLLKLGIGIPEPPGSSPEALGISIPEPDRLPRIRPEDLVIIDSKIGETPELLSRLKSIKGQGNKIVLMTGNEKSKLATKVSKSPRGLVVKINTGIEQLRPKGVVRSYKERGLRGLFPEQEKPSEMYFHIFSAFYFRALALAVKENLNDKKIVRNLKSDSKVETKVEPVNEIIKIMENNLRKEGMPPKLNYQENKSTRISLSWGDIVIIDEIANEILKQIRNLETSRDIIMTTLNVEPYKEIKLDHKKIPSAIANFIRLLEYDEEAKECLKKLESGASGEIIDIYIDTIRKMVEINTLIFGESEELNKKWNELIDAKEKLLRTEALSDELRNLLVKAVARSKKIEQISTFHEFFNYLHQTAEKGLYNSLKEKRSILNLGCYLIQRGKSIKNKRGEFDVNKINLRIFDLCGAISEEGINWQQSPILKIIKDSLENLVNTGINVQDDNLNIFVSNYGARIDFYGGANIHSSNCQIEWNPVTNKGKIVYSHTRDPEADIGIIEKMSQYLKAANMEVVVDNHLLSVTASKTLNSLGELNKFLPLIIQVNSRRQVFFEFSYNKHWSHYEIVEKLEKYILSEIRKENFVGLSSFNQIIFGENIDKSLDNEIRNIINNKLENLGLPLIPADIWVNQFIIEQYVHQPIKERLKLEGKIEKEIISLGETPPSKVVICLKAPVNFKDIKKLKMLIGNILVVPTLSLELVSFAKREGISGIIVEQCGLLSHPAIVSRENKIPVIRIPNATKKYINGEYLSITKEGNIVSHSETKFNTNLWGLSLAMSLQKAMILATAIMVAFTEKMPGQAKYLPVVLWGATMFIALLNTLRNREQVHSSAVKFPNVDKTGPKVFPLRIIDQLNTSI